MLAEHVICMCQRRGDAASLMYFDLDKFKPINDRYGHAEGDRALRDFAQLLKNTFRDSDVIGRIGGDEFAVFATGAADDVLGGALDRLHTDVKEFNRDSQRGYDIAYSVGAVTFDAARHRDVGDIMNEADMLMYHQKRRQRAAQESQGAVGG